MTVKQRIADTLEDLTQADFRKFCHLLTDRRDDPRIRRGAVEDKSIWEIVELMVSTFTEPEALRVALDTLRQMDRNQEAKTLEQNTKAFLDTGDPTLRRTSAGELETNPSQEALNYVAPYVTMKKPEEVEADAKALVLSECGDPCNTRLVLSRYKILFGKYKGKTFKWLLENDVDYVAWLLSECQKEQEGANGSKSPLDANKEALSKYVSADAKLLEEVFLLAYKKSREAARNSGQKGKVLVGIGRYRWITLEDLYESKDPQKISYVDSLRKRMLIRGRSRTKFAVEYILQRDKAKRARMRRINGSTRSSTMRYTRRPEWNRSQPTRASGRIRTNQNLRWHPYRL